jgi:hypothetical protein
MPDLSYDTITSLLGSAQGMRWKNGAYRGKLTNGLKVLVNTLNGFGADTSAMTYHITDGSGRIHIWGCVDNYEADIEGKRICLDEKLQITKTVFESPKFQCIVRSDLSPEKTDEFLMRVILTCA